MTLLNQEKAAAILERAGITPTPRRVDIARILFARPQHLSADQVLGQLKTLGQDCSRATVYNTLGLLQRHGLVRAVVVDPSRVFFDSTPSPHQHFYNVDTGELLDIPPERITLDRTPPLPVGTEYAGTDVIVRIRQTR